MTGLTRPPRQASQCLPPHLSPRQLPARTPAKGFTACALLAASLLAGGCTSGDLPTDHAAPAIGGDLGALLAVSGADDGALVDGFGFLPPIGNARPGGAGSDGHLEPVIEICPDDACDTPLDTLEPTLAGGHFQARWQPHGSGAAAGEAYLLRVRVGDLVVGAVPVLVVANAREARARANAEGAVVVVARETLPIRFHLTVGGAVRLEVVPGAATIEIGETQSFEAIFRDLAGEEVAGPEVSWSVSDAGIASIATDPENDAHATATGIAEGEVQVVASAGGLSASATLAVEPPEGPSGPVFLVPGNTSNVATYEGWSARCLEWDGRTCLRPQLMVSCETCDAYVAGDEWHDFTDFNNLSNAGAQRFCAIAAGSPSVAAAAAGEIATGPRACSFNSSAHPICEANRATVRVIAPGFPTNAGLAANDAFCGQGTARRLTVDCSAW
jgi:hypothetical protein